MDKGKRILIIILTIAYVISPLDLFPGPVDDVIVAILGILTSSQSED